MPIPTSNFNGYSPFDRQNSRAIEAPSLLFGESNRLYSEVDFLRVNSLGNSFGSDVCRDKMSYRKLLAIARMPLVSAAIEKIANGVAGMKWNLVNKEEEKGKHEAEAARKEGKPIPEVSDTLKEERALRKKQLTNSLRRPNLNNNDIYKDFAKSIVFDLCVFNVATIERQPSAESDKNRAFWLWDVPPYLVRINPTWTADRAGMTPRFYFSPYEGAAPSEWTPILDENMFCIKNRTNSSELVSYSPLQIAYDTINTWMGLHRYQDRVVSNPVRDFMISLEDCRSKEEVTEFRNYWRTEVVGNGFTPIIGGKVGIVKIGAKTDEELYLKFKDHLAAIIALCFGMGLRDFNVEPNTDNRATSGVAADASFQNSIKPISDTLLQNFDMKVIEFYDEDYRLEVSDVEPRGEEQEAATAGQLYKDELITRNEGRRRIGEADVPDGDKFKESTEAKKGEELAPDASKPPGKVEKSNPTKVAAQLNEYQQLALF